MYLVLANQWSEGFFILHQYFSFSNIDKMAWLNIIEIDVILLKLSIIRARSLFWNLVISYRKTNLIALVSLDLSVATTILHNIWEMIL